MQRPVSSVQRPESRVQNPAFRVQHLESSVQSPASKVRRPESSIQNAGSRMQRPESNVQLFRPQSRNSGIPHSCVIILGLLENHIFYFDTTIPRDTELKMNVYKTYVYPIEVLFLGKCEGPSRLMLLNKSR